MILFKKIYILFIMNKYSVEDIFKWKDNPTINPLTNRKIKINGPIYNKLKKLYESFYKRNINNYYSYRKNVIDPILLIKLPLHKKKISDLFCFRYTWNPYNGDRLSKDKDGPLYFDPCTLVHYYYINRLKNLWIEGFIDNEEYYEGHYGDALGNGPDFEIKGRGKHPDWYLFRLPIIDCYVENNYSQAVTMGPILTDKEISTIYNLSKKYNFKKIYGYNRPNLQILKKLYDIAVKKINYNIEGITDNEIDIIKYQINIDAVEKIKLL